VCVFRAPLPQGYGRNSYNKRTIALININTLQKKKKKESEVRLTFMEALETKSTDKAYRASITIGS
jgi:hypothetical protein